MLRLYRPTSISNSLSELTAHGCRYIEAEQTWTCKHISRNRYPASLLARRSGLQKTYVT
jgi:hypothetical protein